MANRFERRSIVLCPNCQDAFDLPVKRHRIMVEITCPTCPTCRAKLSVQLGVAGVQRAEWAMK